MAQFDIYQWRGDGIEFLIDLQDDMLAQLATRVVAPLAPAAAAGPPMRRLNPYILVGGEEYILLSHLLAAIPASSLGEPVASARTQRDEIVGAVDVLFTGV